MKKLPVPRFLIQLFAAAASNPFIQNFKTGKIYKGGLKKACVPGLNCYSCPAAAGSCPIGSLQAAAASGRFRLSFYVIGFLILIGAVLGRAVCGFLCPFGFFQELLHKIPSPKPIINRRIDRPLRKIKYIMLAAVLLLPVFITNKYGLSSPFFCKYVCPAGTLEAGLPLLAANKDLRAIIGMLFSWKALFAGLTVVSSVFIYRSFCKYICPLGAFYSLFNGISPVRLNVSTESCINCGECTHSCPMQTEVPQNINGAECIRCGKCCELCPTGAITIGDGIEKEPKMRSMVGFSDRRNQKNE